MFIEKTDIVKKGMLPEELDEITRSDDTLVNEAIASGESEAVSYLYDHFDTEAIFSCIGEARHPMLVQTVVDMAIYHLVSRHQVGQDIVDREKRYHRALEWLNSIRKSEIYPDLARRENTMGGSISIVSQNEKKRDNYV